MNWGTSGNPQQNNRYPSEGVGQQICPKKTSTISLNLVDGRFTRRRPALSGAGWLADRPGGWLACRGAAQEDKHYLSQGVGQRNAQKKTSTISLSLADGRGWQPNGGGRWVAASRPASRRRQALCILSHWPAAPLGGDKHYLPQVFGQLRCPKKTRTISFEPLTSCATQGRQALSFPSQPAALFGEGKHCL